MNASVKSYRRFCLEFPDLVDKIVYTDKYNNVDIGFPSNYTQSKRGLENEGSQGNNLIGKRGQVFQRNGETINRQTLQSVSQNEETNGTDKSGILSSSNLSADARGSLADFNNKAGLQPTITSAKDAVDKVSEGKLKFNTYGDIESNVLSGTFVLILRICLMDAEWTQIKNKKPETLTVTDLKQMREKTLPKKSCLNGKFSERAIMK